MASIMVGLSGGVDSSLAAHLLQAEGHDVIGVTLQLIDGAESVIARARAVADRLRIPHRVVDLRQTFHTQVVEPFLAEYAAGRTPNPCVMCNPSIKFGALWTAAEDLGAEALATGHYVRLRTRGDGVVQLMRARDRRKDQSYVLYRLTQAQLRRSRFPLGEYTKDEVRAQAEALGLPSAKAGDSQEICFVPGDYRDFLQAHRPEVADPGPMVDLEGRVLGEHEGLAFYTVGQRRGLGISAPEPLYVLALDMSRNALVVGPRQALLQDEADVGDLHFQVPAADQPTLRADVQIRYNARPVPTTITRQIDTTRATLNFDVPQVGVSPGQSAVFYQGDGVLGGGIFRPTCEPVSSKNPQPSEG